tara:strand:+ start:251 stop:628 length:378 start_codon:yes stop_codon:yes gene_type:complete
MKNKTTNRNFGIVFFIFFSIISFWPLIIHKEDIRLWSLIIGLIFLIFGLLNSKFLTPLNNLWFKFGILLGKVVAPIVMMIVYFFVLTPTGLLVRFFKKDILNLNKNDKNTYWIKKKYKSTIKDQF